MSACPFSPASRRISGSMALMAFLSGLVLSGCAPEPLDALQDSATRLQSCLVKRTYRDECENAQRALEKARLVALKAGRQNAQIEAAIALGKLAVADSEEDSPYADFSKRRREVLAANLMKLNPQAFREDAALAQAIEALNEAKKPLSKRQRAEALLIQSMLEERFPHYFDEPEDGVENDPEILSLVCREGARANAAQACLRYHRQKR